MQDISMILQLFGGLALFLYGMDSMSRAIQLGRASGCAACWPGARRTLWPGL